MWSMCVNTVAQGMVIVFIKHVTKNAACSFAKMFDKMIKE